MSEKEKYLVYVKPFAKNNDGTYEYELFFSENPDIVWGVDWDIYVPNSLGDLTPEKTTYEEIIHIKTIFPFKTVEEISCFSMEYAVYGIVALSWVDIENLEDYPPDRAVLHFGDSFDVVKEILEKIFVKLEN